jgi:hypothetical protein
MRDQLREFINEFVDGCGIEPPFYLLSIGSNGSIIVTHLPADGGTEHVCERIVEPGLVTPIVLAVISMDGDGASARIVKGDHGLRLLPALH